MSAQGAAPGAGTPETRQIRNGNAASLKPEIAARKPPAKWRRVLKALIDRPFLDRRIAATDPAIRDSVLNSTISELTKRGLQISRILVKRPGFEGEAAWLAEYRLDDGQRELARRILSETGRRHGST